MVKHLEIQLPEPQKNRNKKKYKYNSFKSKEMFDFLKKISGLLHAAP
jgi:hypothetical protein